MNNNDQNINSNNSKNVISSIMNIISSIFKFAIKHWKIVLIAIIGIVIACWLSGFLHNRLSISMADSIKYSEIDELSTISCEVPVNHDYEDSWKIPFTQAKIPFTDNVKIFTGNFVVKAGFNFKDVNVVRGWLPWDVYVKMPRVQIMSNEFVDNSLSVKYDNKNFINQFSLEHGFDCLQEMKDKAVANAISTGIYDRAKDSAESLIREKLKNEYGYSGNNIHFVYSD